MPELPEVEVTRRSLAPALSGATIRGAWQGKSLRVALGCDTTRLAGLQIGAVERRGKYILADAGAGVLIIHLGMSGSLQWFADPAPPRSAWVRFELLTDRGVLRLDDPRRFGAVVWHEGADVAQHPLLRRLGREPLEPGFDGALLHAAARGRRVSVKQWLLAGHAVVGVGNIYASEALFEAGIHPATAAGRLSRARCDRLAQAVRGVLGRAIEAGGSTLRDFSDAQGQAGHFQHAAAVYGRAGEPCMHCGRPVRRIVQGQRSTFYCPSCQRR